MKTLFCALTICFGLVAPLAAESLSVDQAVALSKEQGKPIFIDFYAVWCGPCKQFKKAAHSDNDIKGLLEKVVMVTLDAEKGVGKEMATRFNVHSYPTFVIVNSDLQTIGRFSGYEKNYFSDNFNQIFQDLRPIETKLASLEKNPEDSKLSAYMATYYESQNDFENALKYFQQAEKYSKDKTFVPDMFNIRYRQWSRKPDAYSFSEMETFAKPVFNSPQVSTDDRILAASMMTEICKRTDQTDTIATYIQSALKDLETVSKNDPSYQYYLNEMKLDEALFVLKDREKAYAMKKSQMPENWQDNAGQLNNFTWWCFENKLHLDEAAKLAQKAVGLASPGRAKAMILDTLAEIEFSRGNVKGAIVAIKQAIEEAPGKASYEKQLERFQKEAGPNAG